jgi:non-ribosomal peptide synthetase component F
VQIHHGGFFNRLSWARDYYALTADDVIMSKTPLTFDPSIHEQVLPFIAGCSVLVANPKLLVLPNYLIDCMIEYRVSMLIVVPSLLRQILNAEAFARCTWLRHVVCCGEPWSTDLITLFHRALPNGNIYNGYGPTETTIGTLVYRPARGHAEPLIPIGRPIKGVHVAIVDDSYRNVPAGEIGELIIGGVCVGPGYLGNEDLNAAKFRSLPVRDVGDVRFYLSGDLARQLPDGEVVFMGRKDNQVKINGVRIELEEIESVLKQHELVTNAVVLKDRDHLSDTLHAFVTAAQRLETQALQRHCAGRLSRQVVPSYFHQVDELPVSQNGKVDRRAVWEQYLASRAERA